MTISANLVNDPRLTAVLAAPKPNPTDLEFQIWEHHPDKDSKCLCRRRGDEIKAKFRTLAVGEDRPIGDYTWIVRSR